MIGVFTAAYVRLAQVESPWVFAVIGFVATYMVLGSNASDKEQQLGWSWSPEDHAVIRGAGYGILLGLPAYILLYLWPELILALPGMADLFTWVFRLAGWLISFWFVKAILFFVVAGYFLNVGFMLLIGGGVAIAAVFDGAKSMFRRSDAA